MYVKMQKSGLTEIIPLIQASHSRLSFTPHIWGRCPVLPHPEFPQGAPLGVGCGGQPQWLTTRWGASCL